eukprot:ANDGO_08042.mRNA.1 Acyl-CoA-binding protein
MELSEAEKRLVWDHAFRKAVAIVTSSSSSSVEEASSSDDEELPTAVLGSVDFAGNRASGSGLGTGDLSNEDKLQVYALYKQATEGDLPVERERPGWTRAVERAKFDAWAKKRGMSGRDAQIEYVRRVCGEGVVDRIHHAIAAWRTHSPGPSLSLSLSHNESQSQSHDESQWPSQSESQSQSRGAVSRERLNETAGEEMERVERRLDEESRKGSLETRLGMLVVSLEESEVRLRELEQRSIAALEKVELRLASSHEEMVRTREVVLERLRDVAMDRASAVLIPTRGGSSSMSWTVLLRKLTLWGGFTIALAWVIVRITNSQHIAESVRRVRRAKRL